jgi:hypothetical protein
LVYRRIVEDLGDNNEILDDTYAMLYTPAHLTRQLCDDPCELEITLLYCDRQQYNVTDGAEMATPGANVRVGSTIEAEHDFGVRRWLADAGCGRDLVSTSVVLKGGGEAYVRVRAPQYLNTANGITAVARGMAMYIPQLDEMADILCLANAPSVLSIRERCVTAG